MLLSSRKDSHDYQLMPEVDLDPKQDLLIEKEVYSSFNGGRFNSCHLLPARLSCMWHLAICGCLPVHGICGCGCSPYVHHCRQA